MNIFWLELRFHTKSFLIWSGAMVFLVAAGMMKYGAFQKTGEAINAIFAAMPPAMMSVMGIDPTMDLTSIGVFYSMFFLFFLLLMSVHSTMLGVSIIAREERDKTADFLLVKPIRRSQAVTPKILAALVMVILYNLVTFTVSVLIVARYNLDGPSLNGPIFSLTSVLLTIQILFLGIGLFLGASARNIDQASGIGTAIILSTFIFKILVDLNDDLEKLKFLSPFCYISSYHVMFNGEIPFAYIFLSLGLAALGIAGTYFFFQKRDLRT